MPRCLGPLQALSTGLIVVGVICATIPAFGESKSDSLKQEFSKLAQESNKLRVPCEAFNQAGEKLLRTSAHLDHFKTNVLTEAALSQLRSYPGTPSATSKALARLTNTTANELDAATLRTIEELYYCTPTMAGTLWQKVLSGAKTHNLALVRINQIKQAALSHVEKEASHPNGIAALYVCAALLKELSRLNYISATINAPTSNIVRKLEQLQGSSARTNDLRQRLLQAEPMRREILSLLEAARTKPKE